MVLSEGKKTRKSGKNVRTGLEDFDAIWKAAPASVKRRWTKEEIDDMRRFTQDALSKFQAAKSEEKR